MKILIFGASGSGSTSLGKALGEKLNWLHLDSDEYYWKKTTPPFQVKIPLEKRNAAMTKDFESASNVIVSGSMFSWGEEWKSVFDLAIFLFVPKAIRMARLQKREIERYGDLLETDPVMIETSKEFLEWADKYDFETFDGRSITEDKDNMRSLTCRILKIRGDLTVDERVMLIIENMNELDALG